MARHKTMKFAEDYCKLYLPIFSTIRTRRKGFCGDIMMVESPLFVTFKAIIINVDVRVFGDIPFHVLKDDMAHYDSGGDYWKPEDTQNALDYLNTFYARNPLTMRSKVYVHKLKRLEGLEFLPKMPTFLRRRDTY